MKIAYNPLSSPALSAAPAGSDIIFDLPGISIYAKGVRFKGTDTTYNVFKKHTSSGSGGYNGLVPVPSYTTTSIRYLREDGTWQVPTPKVISSTYTLLSNEDFNTLMGEGRWYFIPGSSTTTNGPSGVNSGAELYVGRNASGYRYQKVITASGIVWFRYWNATAWQPWVRWYTDANTDNSVLQSVSTTANFRPLIIGYTNSTDPAALTATVTNLVYTANAIYALPSTATLFARIFDGDLRGNADTSTSLGNVNVGNAALPVYFAAGKPVACVASSLFSVLTNDNKLLSVTVAGLNRKLTISYASVSERTNALQCFDIRSTTPLPKDKLSNSVTSWFNLTGTPDTGWWGGLTIKGWSGNYEAWEIAGPATSTNSLRGFFLRSGALSTWNSWERILTSANTSLTNTANDIIIKINNVTATLPTEGSNDGRYVRKIGDVMTGGLKNTAPDAYRLAYGSYGTILSNDGSSFYILLTDSGAALSGGYNSLRPFAIALGTGLVRIGHGLNVSGTIVGSSTIQGTRLISTVAAGTAPLTVTSNTLVGNLNSDLLDNYHLSDILPNSIYHTTLGSLVTTDISSASNSMITVNITGNSYGAGRVINTVLQFYNYNSENYIGAATATHFGFNFGTFQIFNYNGKVCFWFKLTGNYLSYTVTARVTNSSVQYNRVTTITNVAMPTSGVTRLISVTPYQGAYLDSNVASATKLETARAINGTLFDGTAAITTARWGYARTLTLTGSITGSATIDGSGNVNLDTTYQGGNIGNLDARYVNITGDTMTGFLQINTSGVYVKFGCQNSAYAHYETSASSGHYFNKNVGVNGAIRVHNTGTYMNATGFYRNGSSNSYTLLGGGGQLAYSTDPDASTLVLRTSSGYIFGTYFNSAIGDESPAIGSVFIRNTSDNYIRRTSYSNFISNIGTSLDSRYVNITGDTMTGALKFNLNNNGDANVGGGDGFKLFYNNTTGSNFPELYSNVASFLTGYTGFQLASQGSGDQTLWFRKRQDNGTWHPWHSVLHTGNYTTTLDARYVNITGDTMTGALNMNSRLIINPNGYISPTSTSTRRSGMYGVYDSYKTGHIWSMGAAYVIPDDGSTFGNLYGLAYKHTNNGTGGTMAGGHQSVWCVNGSPKAALGENGVWAANGFYKAESNDNYVLLGAGGHFPKGNATGNIPISNGTVNTNLNTDMLDGLHSTNFARSFNQWSPSTNVTLTMDEYVTKMHTNLNFTAWGTSSWRHGWWSAGTDSISTPLGTIDLAGAAVYSNSFLNDSTSNYKTMIFHLVGGETYKYTSEETSLKSWVRYWTTGNLTPGNYVTALGTSGDFLTWTRNGTVNNILVPKAYKSDLLEAYTASGFTGGSHYVRAIRSTSGWTTRLYMGYYRDTTLQNTILVAYADNAGNSDKLDNYSIEHILHGTTWINSPGLDADTMAANTMNFTYSNKAPHTGSIVYFGGATNNSYGFLLNASYGGALLSFRSRNGNNGSWLPWRTVATTADLAGYVTSLGTSGNSLTWVKNGTTNYITVPYATNSDTVDGYHESSFMRFRGELTNATTGFGGIGLYGWATSSGGFGETYGDSISFQGYSSWYRRLDFGASGRIRFWQGINTTIMSLIGTIAWTSDILDPANYYWANIRISALSSTGTSPTFSTAYASNWFRSSGQTGWINASYGGGIYQIDSTYVRVYGSKIFYAASGYLAPYTGSSWITMATRTDCIHPAETTSSSAAHALYRLTYNNGNRIAFGGLGNEIGFYGFSAANVSSGNNAVSWSSKWYSDGSFHTTSTMASAGFKHNSVNSDNYALLAGGGYKALTEMAVPRGTIIMYLGSDTPTGWEDITYMFAGRFPMGVGTTKSNLGMYPGSIPSDLNATLNSTGGQNYSTMDADYLPAHYHRFVNGANNYDYGTYVNESNNNEFKRILHIDTWENRGHDSGETTHLGIYRTGFNCNSVGYTGYHNGQTFSYFSLVPLFRAVRFLRKL